MEPLQENLPEQIKPNNKKTIRNLIIWILIIVVVSLSAYFFARNFIVRWPIAGESMEPTISDKDVVLLFSTKNTDYDDIIVFRLEDEDKYLIKRVIGKEGDVISSKKDENGYFHLYRNDNLLDESYIKNSMLSTGGYTEFTMTVPEGTLFVLGDNRNNSSDSHLGIMAKVSLVEGVAFARISSSGRFTFL